MDPVREAYWREKFGSFWIRAEPVDIEGHLRIRFYATIVMSCLLAMIGLMILAIFGAFGRPDVGVRIFGFLFMPVVFWTWLDYAILRHRVHAYIRERDGSVNVDGPTG
jgi:hypothetical protein